MVDIDSLNTTNPYVFTAGGDISDYFGTTEATAYSRLNFSTSAIVPDEDALLDSARFSVDVTSLTAEDLDDAKTFSAHMLTEQILDTTYYNFDHIPYQESPFATGSFMLKENSDTVLLMNMDEALANDMFTKLKSDDPVFHDIFSFRNYFPGFALKGAPEQQTTINVRPGVSTGIKFYYRNSSEDTVSSIYTIYSSNSRHFNGMVNDATGTPTEIIKEKNTAYDPGQIKGSKSLRGLVVKLDMEPLSNFLDTVQQVVFNYAEISLGPVENFPESKYVPSYMIAYFTDDTNKILTRESDGALYSIQSGSFQVVTDEDGNVLPYIGTTTTNPLIFNSEKFTYFQIITDYVDGLYRNDVMRTDLLLYPRTPNSSASPPYSNDIIRSMREYEVNQNSIKLKIYYSKLN
ncbi:hypothetical protein GCM10007049_31030 [Echinicola pacifica]|uniref:DUF4270 domain-containing protein n=1 Tax=Echinicola pacifica TaxID=346377 RepID=A0A918UU19_9BACT|nr:hypothetical protein GCM10007049_31030 [Echinicola pacifica]